MGVGEWVEKEGRPLKWMREGKWMVSPFDYILG